MLPCHLISLRGDIDRPARSIDLNPGDFFVCGYLKSNVYTHRPRSLEQFKDAICQEIVAIAQEMIGRIMDKFHERLSRYSLNADKHLIDDIFKTKWPHTYI